MAESDAPDDTKDILPVRRRVLNIFGGLGIVAFFGSLLAPVKDLAIAAKGSQSVELPGQRLVLANEFTAPGGQTFGAGDVVTTDMLSETPTSALTYPENLSGQNDYLIRVQHVEADKLKEPTKLDWTQDGFVAYSAVCTHLGCTVGYENSDDEPPGVSAEQKKGASMHCPCHDSVFDIYDGAEVIGGPAPRPVPQIAVEVNDAGEVTLASDFEAKVGAS